MNSTNSSITKLQANDTVSLAVIIGGTFEGITQGSTQLQSMIATYVEVNDVDDFNEDWILDNVETYPLLSTTPLALTYDVKQDLDITFDEDNDEDVTYYIDDIDTEFGSLQSLEDWISECIAEFDYTAEQVKSWDIEKRIKTRVDIEIEGDDEYDITAYGARRIVSDFIEAPAPPTDDTVWRIAKDDVEVMFEDKFPHLTFAERATILERVASNFSPIGWVEELADFIALEHLGQPEEIDTADHEVALGHPDTIERGAKVWALSEYYANKRLTEHKPVYRIDDEGRGVRIYSLEEVRNHIRQGGMVGRVWNVEDNEY